ncbi:MAG: hypothetical protein PHR06_07035 [Candidatus Cloacimonetes bacterium]|nr:hypothetical protein [Candidatus Cloacimonadota bacterium]
MRIILPIILMSFLFVSCYVPRPVFLVKEGKEPVISLMGVEVTKLSQDNVDIIVHFDKSRHGIFSFDFLVANNSDKPINIAPEEFYCTVRYKLKEKGRIDALSPELVIAQNLKEIESSLAEIQTESNTELLFEFFDLIEKKRELKDVVKEEESRIRNDINRLYLQKEIISSKHPLCNITLLPNKKTSGKLFFDTPFSITSLVLNFSVGSKEIKLEYRAEKKRRQIILP